MFLAPLPTQAYIDPGTGSYFFQMLFGLIFGGLVAVKIFFRHLKTFFSKLVSKRKDPNSDDAA
ncbi:MAG: hypothetical protein HY420_01935 [Candidatus Kerfeldbacteria bacterium]|nr:hypothetical protein [Candidatus Kerfeldbacteria bacterium]